MAGLLSFLQGQGHPAENSTDDTLDKANVSGDEPTVLPEDRLHMPP